MNQSITWTLMNSNFQTPALSTCPAQCFSDILTWSVPSTTYFFFTFFPIALRPPPSCIFYPTTSPSVVEPTKVFFKGGYARLPSLQDLTHVLSLPATFSDIPSFHYLFRILHCSCPFLRDALLPLFFASCFKTGFFFLELTTAWSNTHTWVVIK